MKTWEIWKAHDEGKKIQIISQNNKYWSDIDPHEYTKAIASHPCNFRVKAEPKKVYVITGSTGVIVSFDYDKSVIEDNYRKYYNSNYIIEEYIQVV